MNALEAVAELLASSARTLREAVRIQRATAQRIVELLAENAALRAEIARLRAGLKPEVRQ